MASLHRGVTGRPSGCDHLEPLAVSPRQACRLLDIGITRLYQLIANRELDAYRDGRSRKITMESIRSRQARLIAAGNTTGSRIEAAPQPLRRGRPRKLTPKAAL
jgi:excisionase family DNA binding protein